MTDEQLFELEQLLDQIDIVEYISQYVELEEKNGEFWGLSPFKDENTPSFSVRRESNSFYCFSSGIGGNAFTFTRFYAKCSISEALSILKSYVGLGENEMVKMTKLPVTMSCRKFRKKTPTKKVSVVKKYPPNYMEKYEKSPNKLAVWENEGISKESLDKFQVYYDSFSDRLVYPIRNIEGTIVNIGGRTLDQDWKAKDLRKYTYFSGWGEMDVIYGLYENMQSIMNKREIILFEGCKSVLLADSNGIHNTGALLTSHLNPAQMKILAKLGVRVVFALDKDVRVRDDRNINKLKRYVNVEYLWDKEDLLNDKDAPLDKGIEIFESLYRNRLRLR